VRGLRQGYGAGRDGFRRPFHPGTGFRRGTVDQGRGRHNVYHRGYNNSAASRPSSGSRGDFSGDIGPQSSHVPAASSQTSAVPQVAVLGAQPGTDNAEPLAMTALAQAAAILGQALDTKQTPNDKLKASAAPEQVAILLQQVLLAAQGGTNTTATELTQKPPVKEGSGKFPYCFRCLTKGHRQEECHTELHCNICNNSARNTDRCPQLGQPSRWHRHVYMLWMV
jgi:hypothetical protein